MTYYTPFPRPPSLSDGICEWNSVRRPRPVHQAARAAPDCPYDGPDPIPVARLGKQRVLIQVARKPLEHPISGADPAGANRQSIGHASLVQRLSNDQHGGQILDYHHFLDAAAQAPDAQGSRHAPPGDTPG